MDNTLLIIGRSPILDSAIKHINYLVELYPSIGINSSAVLINTKYCAFVDETYKKYINKLKKDIELITIDNFAALSERFKCNYYTTFRLKKGDDVLQDNKLAYYGFTHDLCLSWAILNNYNNVVLIGAADFCSSEYSSVDINLGVPTFNRDLSVEESSINAINNIYSKHINIYTVNENSRLNVPRITLEELYNK